MKTVLEISNLAVGYAKKTILSNVSFSVDAGEMVAIIGRNGTGKTTLLKTIAGIQPALAGNVLVDGNNMHTMHERTRARHLAFVATDKVKLAGIDVLTSVAFGRYAHTGTLGWSTAQDETVARNCLLQLAMQSFAARSLDSLSDGEMQKVMIARALAQQTPLLVLDEPTAFLDYVAREEVFALLHNLSTQSDKAILFSSHDLELVKKYADRVIDMGNF